VCSDCSAAQGPTHLGARIRKGDFFLLLDTKFLLIELEDSVA